MCERVGHHPGVPDRGPEGAVDQDVKEDMEAKAEQAGNLVHVRNDREAFRLVGELSGNKWATCRPSVKGGGYFVGQKQRTKAHFERVLNVNNDVDPAALRGIAGMLAASGPSRPY